MSSTRSCLSSLQFTLENTIYCFKIIAVSLHGKTRNISDKENYLRITEKRHRYTINTRASYINRICFLTSQRQFWRNFQSIVSFQCPILEFQSKKKKFVT